NPECRGPCPPVYLLVAVGPRPVLYATYLLLPRADRTDLVFVLRLGCVEGAPLPAHAGRARRPRELRGDPPGRHLRRADATHRIDLGEGVLGRLVVVEREPARPLPRPVSLLLRVLHAALLARPRPG